MASAEAIVADLAEPFIAMPAQARFASLYADEAAPLDHVFAVLHGRLNELLRFMNAKWRQNGHYNAEASRDLLGLIRSIEEMRHVLRRVGIDVDLRSDYRERLEYCETFLAESYGSEIPSDYEQFNLERFERVFSTGEGSAQARGTDQYPLILIGEGSYALVHKYLDEHYGTWVAVKTARRTLSPQEHVRFKQEFQLLQRLSFPYVVEAYRFDDERSRYYMEYCDVTLKGYLKETNNALSWAARKRIALQFLYGLNYLHRKDVLHRDLSVSNVLIKKYDLGAVTVKLSDFGLSKLQDSDLTRTGSSMKGTVVDPTLESFKKYGLPNEIYGAGHILSFIFSGRMGLGGTNGPVQQIVQRCTDHDLRKRYGSIADVIIEVEALTAPAPELGAPAPA